jgi:hypothetical protein
LVFASVLEAQERGRLAHAWFEDVANAWGFHQANAFGGAEKKRYILESTGTGVAILDFDGDGWDDVFLVNGTTLNPRRGQEPKPQLYQNLKGRFQDVAAKAGLTKTGWGQGACAGDYQNDGATDLFVTYYGRNVLYKNVGSGTFQDVTKSAGLHGERDRWGAGCAFLDFDRDGLLDLFVANYVELDLAKTPGPGERPDCLWKGIPVFCGPRGLPAARNILYRNHGDGTFRDVSEKAGILSPGPRYGLGVAAADFDNDGWPDIYVACDMTASLLYRNLGNGRFEERGMEAGVAYNFDGRLQSGMGVAVGDYDRNGFLDLVKTNFSGDLPSLYNNEDGRFFSDLSQPAGLALHQYVGWGVALVDADEDGWPDIVLANGHVYPEVDGSATGERYRYPTLLYSNRRDGRFMDWTALAGPAFEPSRPSRGLATGDLDGDGHPEIVIVNMNEPPSVLRNTAGRRNAILISLSGTRSNRSAIGARVIVETEDGRQMQDVAGGGSYYSHNSFRLHFGLGDRDEVRRLSVRWPDGNTQRWSNLPAKRRILIREGGEPVVEPLLKAGPAR